jgi:hypothetical protein
MIARIKKLYEGKTNQSWAFGYKHCSDGREMKIGKHK